MTFELPSTRVHAYLPFNVFVGRFSQAGTSRLVMAQQGSRAMVLSIQGAGPIGAGLRMFRSSNATDWEEFGTLRAEGEELHEARQIIYGSHPFLRVTVDWVLPGTEATVRVRSPATDQTITLARVMAKAARHG